MLAPVLALGAALGAPALDGERLRWEVRYLGVKAGHVTAETARTGADLVTVGVARSAPWYRSIYDLDDRVASTWSPGGGSARYVARFREGRFHQDQDQRFGAEALVVDYRQRKKGAWVAWTDRLDPAPGAFDPVAAMQVVRSLEGPGPWTVPVFSGRQTRPLRVTLVERTTLHHDLLGDVPVRLLDLRTDHRGELEQEGRFRVWVTDDPRRLLVRAVVQTNLGAIRADLVEASVGGPGPAPAAPRD